MQRKAMRWKTSRKRAVRPLLAVYWGSYIVLAIALSVLGFHGSDVELAGVVWAIALGSVYWLAQRVFRAVVCSARPSRGEDGRG